ncbi:hypothetical protein HYW46_00240 [Candidatus Daviesbacteria bacterium]|nr:hypothetical protein [Candidatus Daviesbacteria bacterium]
METPEKKILRDSIYVLWVRLLTGSWLLLAAGVIFFSNISVSASLEPGLIIGAEVLGAILLLMGFISSYEGSGLRPTSSISLFFGLLFTAASAGMMAAPLAVAIAEHTNLVRVLTLAGLTTLVLTVGFWTTVPRIQWPWLLSVSWAILAILAGLNLRGSTWPLTPWDWTLSIALLGYIIRKWIKGMAFEFTLKSAFKVPTLLYMDIVVPLAENL